MFLFAAVESAQNFDPIGLGVQPNAIILAAVVLNLAPK
jgi:hypothetical protein